MEGVGLLFANSKVSASTFLSSFLQILIFLAFYLRI